jgi:hypothetical protein
LLDAGEIRRDTRDFAASMWKKLTVVESGAHMKICSLSQPETPRTPRTPAYLVSPMISDKPSLVDKSAFR